MKRNGFTLIELLFVIAIISLLSSIMLANFREVRAKSRDTHRIQDMHNLSLALALYNSEYQKYPCTGWKNIAVGGFIADEYYVDDSFTIDPDFDAEEDDVPPLFLDGFNTNPSICDDPTGIVNGGFYSVESGQEDILPYPYFYMTPNPDRDEYILFTRLESNTYLMENDGGFCDNYYETGTGITSIRPFTTDSDVLYSGSESFEVFAPDIECNES